MSKQKSHNYDNYGAMIHWGIYSIPAFSPHRKEWTPLYSVGKKKVKNYVSKVLQPQLKELITRYDPDILWADGDWHHSPEIWESDKILKELESRGIITNDRWGKDFDPSEYPGLTIYKTGTDRLLSGSGNWEHVNTISNSWGYAANQTPADYKSSAALQDLAQEIRKKGGRFTINLGLRPDGTFDPREKEVLDKLYF